MSTIDLDRLIVRQTYFIPIKFPVVFDEISRELKDSYPPIGEISPWLLVRRHKYSLYFVYSMEYSYVYRNLLGKRAVNKKTEEETIREYQRMLPQVCEDTLLSLRHNFPYRLIVSAIKVEENGCICEIECSPVLHEKLSVGMIKPEEVNDFMIQDAIITCTRFVKNTFQRGLSATLIAEGKKEVFKPSMEFLTNDVSTRQITQKIETMFTGATGEILIIGWVGTLLLKKLKELKEKGIEVRVITGSVKTIRQDPMRKEKERAMKQLISIIGKEKISKKPEFHGRAIVVDNKALVGSMDLDSYSLTGTRIEFATYTEDPEIVRNLRNYFNRIFSPWKE